MSDYMYSSKSVESLNKLIRLLAEANIPNWVVLPMSDKLNFAIVMYDAEGNTIADAVSHEFSYGGDNGLIEILGLDNDGNKYDDVVGWLSAEEAFDIFNKYVNRVVNAK